MAIIAVESGESVFFKFVASDRLTMLKWMAAQIGLDGFKRKSDDTEFVEWGNAVDLGGVVGRVCI